jgi:hypothetical protein
MPRSSTNVILRGRDSVKGKQLLYYLRGRDSVKGKQLSHQSVHFHYILDDLLLERLSSTLDSDNLR